MFLEIEFPTTISYKAVGGPGFSTNINQGFGGAEARNQNWKFPRGEWTVSLITPATMERQQFIDLLTTFFLTAAGKANAFRLKDFNRFQATAQPVVLNADGAPQLAITHTNGAATFVEFISKPITAGVVDYLGNPLADTVVINGGGPVGVDPTTGIVEAGAGTLVDFQYHYPVRFDVDKLQLQIEESGPGEKIVSWTSIPLIEVSPPDF